MSTLKERIAEKIISIPDYPVKGIVYRDIMPVISDGPLFRNIIKTFADFHRTENIDAVVGIESRGFIFGGALACELGCGFVSVRKPGKLPRETIQISYDLEYGSNTIEIQKDALTPGSRVVLMDDLLATGGTIMAAAHLVHTFNAEIVASDFMVELGFLNPRQKIKDCGKIHSLLIY